MEDGEAPASHELFPWLDPKVQGRQHERRRARQTSARLQPGSGNQPGRREDMRHADHLEQTKRTERGSYRLSAKEFITTKVRAEAEGRSPQWTITFAGANRDGSDLTLIIREEGDESL